MGGKNPPSVKSFRPLSEREQVKKRLQDDWSPHTHLKSPIIFTPKRYTALLRECRAVKYMGSQWRRTRNRRKRRRRR